MDFSCNSKLWAGNIYHHFESICNNVEEFVHKDSVKFVENQVQSVGLSVKRLYSNVVHDILPLSIEILKPENHMAQICQHLREQENATVQNSEDNSSAEKIVTEDLKRATADSSFDSDFFSGKLDKEDLSSSNLREQGNATVQNSEDSSNAEMNATEDLKRATAHSSFDSEFFPGKLDKEDLSSTDLRQQGIATVQNSEGSSNAEKNATEDLKRATADSCFDSEFFSGKLDKEDLSSSDLRQQGIATVQNSEDSSNAEKNATGDLKRATADSSFDSEFFSGKLDKEDIYSSNLQEPGNSTVQNSEGSSNAEKNVKEDLKRATAVSSFDSRFFFGNLDKEYTSSPEFSAHEECSTPIEKEKKDLSHQEGDDGFSDDTANHWDSWLSLSECKSTKDGNDILSTSTQLSEHAFLYNSCNVEEVQMAIMEFTSVDFSTGGNNVLHSRSVSDGFTSDIFVASSISAADNTKEDVDPASSMRESNEDDALKTDMSEFDVGSFESSGNEEHHQNVHLKISISPSETQSTNGLGVLIGDLDLETVELSSNVKHDGKIVYLNSNVVVPGSYRRKNFRYYKKLIQGAFTSQKRLSKEYEHLAIMYGDIDVESNKHFESTSLSAFPKTALHSVETRNGNEWELL